MLGILFLAQALTFGSGPQPIPSVFLSDADYPAEAARQKWSGPLEVDLSISESGRVTACKISLSSGHDVLDKASCKAAATLRFKPARDEAGRAIASGFFLRTAWTLPGQTPLKSPERGPDMTIQVKQLPASAAAIKVSLRMIQEADGSSASCIVAESSPSSAINQAACRLAVPLARMNPVYDSKGVSVRNLRMRQILFEQSK